MDPLPLFETSPHPTGMRLGAKHVHNQSRHPPSVQMCVKDSKNPLSSVSCLQGDSCMINPALEENSPLASWLCAQHVSLECALQKQPPQNPMQTTCINKCLHLQPTHPTPTHQYLPPTPIRSIVIINCLIFGHSTGLKQRPVSSVSGAHVPNGLNNQGSMKPHRRPKAWSPEGC